MRLLVAASLIVVLSSNTAGAQTPTAQPLPAPPSLRASLTDDVIKDAVKQALAEKRKEGRPDRADVLGADTYAQFSRDFSEAQVPGCLHPDAMKHQPTSIQTKDWNLGVSGLLALPFWLTAIARGKCH
jgi:hypothetical protein